MPNPVFGLRFCVRGGEEEHHWWEGAVLKVWIPVHEGAHFTFQNLAGSAFTQRPEPCRGTKALICSVNTNWCQWGLMMQTDQVYLLCLLHFALSKLCSCGHFCWHIVVPSSPIMCLVFSSFSYAQINPTVIYLTYYFRSLFTQNVCFSLLRLLTSSLCRMMFVQGFICWKLSRHSP